MTTSRPLRFGTGFDTEPSRREFFDFVSRIEEMGYSIMIAPDHFGDMFGPLTSLMAAAAASSTLRIGTCVLANDFRHPVVMAKEAATLDLLSEGRFELGLGAGYYGPDYTRSGIQMDAPGTRVSRLMESVEIIKGLFADELVDWSGTFYSVKGLRGTPKPVQRPHPPFFIAGGARRLLSFAGREADIVGLVPPSGGGQLDWTRLGSAVTAEQVEWVRRAAGDRFSTLELNTLVFEVVVTDHPRQAAEQLASSLGVTPELVLESIHFLVGTIEGMADEIQMWRERFGISYVAVREQDYAALGPVVRRLAGA